LSKRIFFHGTMNASKSAQLLMQAYNLERQGKTFIILKPELDTRDGDKVVSRAFKETRKAFPIPHGDTEMIEHLLVEMLPEFVFVDEVSFFTKEQVDALAEVASQYDISVFAYGLMLTFKGELFEGSKRCIENGFSLHELKMQCDYCSNKSTHHIRLVDGIVQREGESIQAGDEEYNSVCYECFLDAHGLV
jgi:thymidine kinase